MQFGTTLISRILTHPVGEKRVTLNVDLQPGLSWENKYGYVGVTAYLDESVDGMKFTMFGTIPTGLYPVPNWGYQDTNRITNLFL